ncbi:hypothetical protein ACS0TY_030091 [Phlomoides rotata]
MICCLDGARLGIQYETSYAGEPCELFHCVLETKSFLEKMTVLEHTIPFFLPIREAENEYLSLNAMKFIDHVGDLLQAYVDRREQVRLIKELYGNQMGELYCSLTYHMVEFVLADFDCKVTVSLGYTDLVSTLPSEISVLAWPVQQPKRLRTGVAPMSRREALGHQLVPARLSHAEDALRTLSLPQGRNGIYKCCDLHITHRVAHKQSHGIIFRTVTMGVSIVDVKLRCLGVANLGHCFFIFTHLGQNT